MKIAELMPNPAGSDTGKEWVKIENDTSSPQNLKGIFLEDLAKKKFNLPDEQIKVGEIKTFYLKGLSLNNSGEKVYLKNSAGEILDWGEYAETISDNVILKNYEHLFLENPPKEILPKEKLANAKNNFSFEIIGLMIIIGLIGAIFILWFSHLFNEEEN